MENKKYLAWFFCRSTSQGYNQIINTTYLLIDKMIII